MKTYLYAAADNDHNKELTASLLDTMATLEEEFGYLLQQGWRAIILVENNNGRDAPYQFDFGSDQDGGFYAEAKMNTLKTFVRHYTGNLNIPTAAHLIRKLLGEDAEKYSEQLYRLEHYSGIDEISDDLAKWMRDTVQFAPYLGGIKVPFQTRGVTDFQVRSGRGYVSIAFSGASQEQDCMFAVLLLRTFMSVLSKDKFFSHKFDLRALREVPAIRLWLDWLELSTLAGLF